MYNPDDDEDPLALGEGKLWCWNYFFYNKKQKKVLFFYCYAQSKNAYRDSMSDTDSDYDSYVSNPKNAMVHYYPRDSDDDMDFDDL
jgi:hypothetical protein